MAENLTAFESAAQRTDAQKKALLDALATQGSKGRESFAQARTQIEGSQQQAIEGALKATNSSSSIFRSGAGEKNVSAAAAPGQAHQQDLSRAEAVFNEDIARQSAGNEQFFGQLQGAIPIVQERTRLAIEQIIREQEEAEKERELRRTLAQLQIQGQQQELAARQALAGIQLQEAQARLANTRAGSSGSGGAGGEDGGDPFGGLTPNKFADAAADVGVETQVAREDAEAAVDVAAAEAFGGTDSIRYAAYTRIAQGEDPTEVFSELQKQGDGKFNPEDIELIIRFSNQVRSARNLGPESTAFSGLADTFGVPGPAPAGGQATSFPDQFALGTPGNPFVSTTSGRVRTG